MWYSCLVGPRDLSSLNSVYARVVQLAADSRLKIYTVWVRVPPRVLTFHLLYGIISLSET